MRDRSSYIDECLRHFEYALLVLASLSDMTTHYWNIPKEPLFEKACFGFLVALSFISLLLA